MNYFFKKK